MFPRRFYPASFFAPRYFAKVGAVPPAVLFRLLSLLGVG
jgi:hypothetical protein